MTTHIHSFGMLTEACVCGEKRKDALAKLVAASADEATTAALTRRVSKIEKFLQLGSKP